MEREFYNSEFKNLLTSRTMTSVAVTFVHLAFLVDKQINVHTFVDLEVVSIVEFRRLVPRGIRGKGPPHLINSCRCSH